MMPVGQLIAAKATQPPSVEHQVVTEIKDAVGTATETASSFMKRMPVLISHLLMAAAVIIIGFILLRIGKLIISKVVRNHGKKRRRSSQRTDTIRSIFSSVYSYIIYLLMIAVVLRIFGANLSSILTVAGVGGVAIAFGSQTLVKDIISGLFLWGEGSIAVGDLVSINDLTGTVEAISVRTTVLRNYNGNLFTIPNGDIRTITNMSRGFKRAIINIRCPYEADQQKLVAMVEEEMQLAAVEIEGISETPTVMSIVSFETDAVMLQIAVPCPVGEHWRIERDIRTRVKARFDREGIVMPHYTAPKYQ